MLKERLKFAWISCLGCCYSAAAPPFLDNCLIFSRVETLAEFLVKGAAFFWVCFSSCSILARPSSAIRRRASVEVTIGWVVLKLVESPPVSRKFFLIASGGLGREPLVAEA